MWPIKFKPHSRFALPCCIFPKQIVDVICNFPNNIPDILTFFQKSLLRNFWYEVRHSMIKSASIVRNLSKIHTFRTIASILIDTQSRFPANLTILIIQLQEARINPIGYNYSTIYPILYPNGIILA